MNGRKNYLVEYRPKSNVDQQVAVSCDAGTSTCRAYILLIYIYTQTHIMLYCVYILGFVVDTMLVDRRTRRVWCTFNHSWTAARDVTE